MSRWHFSPKRPSDKTRDPVASEFFSSDAIKNAGEALVREGIQNSLDARTDRVSGKAVVRIYLSGQSGALAPERHKSWFETAWTHYGAPKNGLKPESIGADQPCRYLAFEDFGTTGLTGDREQYQPVEGVTNAFFNFFRAEGKTDKAGDDRGRWGVGKQVFPRSSQAQTFFGYTETPEGGFLMGGCVLKHHSIGDTCFKPDGFWGETLRIADDNLTIPVSSPEVIAAFRRDFMLQRQPGQYGLSVVVPWLDDSEEGKDKRAFERGTLTLAVIEGYFIPILEGRLEVSVEDQAGTTRISRDTYREALTQLSVSADDKRRAELERVEALVALVENAQRGTARSFVLPPCSDTKAAWSDGMLTEGTANEMRQLLADGGTLELTAIVTVRPKGGQPERDSFRCFVTKADRLSIRPCHVREDIVIPSVDSSRINGYVCVVRIDGGPLATLLGDSEGPAHTEWQASSRNFKDKYVYGGLVIDFVSQFPAELLRRVHANSKQLDRRLLLDLFQDQGPEPSPVVGPKPPGPKPPPPVVVVPKPAKFRISDTATGFTVASAGTGLPIGTTLEIQTAYETSKGNAFKAYNKNDFQLTDREFEVNVDGCRVEERAANAIAIVTEAGQFTCSVSGFDVNRDVVVKVVTVATEGESGSNQPEAE